MRKILKKIADPLLKKGLKLYYSKPRKYSYDGLQVVVHPDVFPPHLTLSTKILLNFIKSLNIDGKSLLELGCGSGIISLYAAKKGAKVTASDINKTALNYLEKAVQTNQLEVEVVFSDLFESLEGREFDIIVINPPYYPKTPANTKEKAWYCGEDHEYFKKLFRQLPDYITKKNEVYMILSEDCDFTIIKTIGAQNKIDWSVVHKKKIMGELNYIYRLEQIK